MGLRRELNLIKPEELEKYVGKEVEIVAIHDDCNRIFDGMCGILQNDPQPEIIKIKVTKQGPLSFGHYGKYMGSIEAFPLGYYWGVCRVQEKEFDDEENV